MTTTRNTKRKDKARVVLRKGESQRKDGKYDFRWTSPDGKRHSIYAPTLEELREKEKGLQLDSLEGIKAEARYVTLNDVFTLWAKVKRGLKDNTFQNYLYLYRQFVEPDFGKSKVSALKKSDVKQFYNMLADERGLQISTIDSVHTVLHQVLDMAVDDCYLRSNPSDNVLRELKKAHQFETTHRKALTIPEQNLLLSYLSKTPKYQHWYPIFAVMLGTGLRVGEATGLRWCDVDFEESTISVNHTLVNYDHRENNGGKKGCYFNCHSPKTKGMQWYELQDNEVAEVFTAMNPDQRLFFAKFETPSFVNQRLIGLTHREEYPDEELNHALINSMFTMFYIEASGFGRGLGVLDVNKDSIENCYMLNPDLVDVNDRQRILQSFNSVKARKIMKVEDELKDEDRIAFEHTVLQSFGIDDYFDKIKSSLLSMQATRKTVKEL